MSNDCAGFCENIRAKLKNNKKNIKFILVAGAPFRVSKIIKQLEEAFRIRRFDSTHTFKVSNYFIS
jgi:hypothetical protein